MITSYCDIYRNDGWLSQVWQGNREIDRVFKGSELVWQLNFIDKYMIWGSTTNNGLTVNIIENSNIIINGTCTRNCYLKISNNLELNNSRPVLWNEETLGDIPITKLHVKIIPISGSFTTPAVWAADAFNFTLRYDNDNIFINNKIGLGVTDTVSTTTAMLRTCVIWIRAGMIFDNFKFIPLVYRYDNDGNSL